MIMEQITDLTERTIQIDLPILLGDVHDEDEARLKRLEEALRQRRGIQRVHIKQEDAQAQICLHYDPNQVSLADVRRGWNPPGGTGHPSPRRFAPTCAVPFP